MPGFATKRAYAQDKEKDMNKFVMTSVVKMTAEDILDGLKVDVMKTAKVFGLTNAETIQFIDRVESKVESLGLARGMTLEEMGFSH